MSAYSFEDYSARRNDWALRNKSVVQIGTHHPLNNPNRPEFMSSGSAARALFRHAYGNLTGQTGNPQSYWNALQDSASIVARDKSEESNRDGLRSREVVMALGSSDDDVTPEQLEGGYLSAMSRQSLYANLSDGFTRTEKESIVNHLTARAIGEATGSAGDVRPARGAIGREAERAAQSDSYKMLLASVSQIWNTTRANPIDDRAVDFDNLDDTGIVEQAELVEATRLRKTQNVVKSFADSYLLDQVDEIASNNRMSRNLTNGVVVMESAEEAAVMKALLDWTVKKSQENGGALPSLEEIKHDLRHSENSVYKSFTETKVEVIQTRVAQSTAVVEGLIALSDVNYLDNNLAKATKTVQDDRAAGNHRPGLDALKAHLTATSGLSEAAVETGMAAFKESLDENPDLAVATAALQDSLGDQKVSNAVMESGLAAYEKGFEDKIAAEHAKITDGYKALLNNDQVRGALTEQLRQENVLANKRAAEAAEAAETKAANGEAEASRSQGAESDKGESIALRMNSDDLKEAGRDLRMRRDRTGRVLPTAIPHTAEVAKLAALHVRELTYDNSKSARQGGEWVKFGSTIRKQEQLFSNAQDTVDYNRFLDKSNKFSALRATVIDGASFYKNDDAIKARVEALHEDNRAIEKAARNGDPIKDGENRLYPAAIMIGKNTTKETGLGGPQKAVLDKAAELGIPVVDLTVTFARTNMREAGADGDDMRRVSKNEMSYVVSKEIPNPALREGEPRSVTVTAFMKSDEGQKAVDLAMRTGDFGHKDVLPRTLNLSVDLSNKDQAERDAAVAEMKNRFKNTEVTDKSVVARVDLRSAAFDDTTDRKNAAEIMEGRGPVEATSIDVTVDIRAREAAQRQYLLDATRDAFTRTDLPPKTVTVTAELESKNFTERNRARDMMQGAVVLVDGKANSKNGELNESQGRMIRWQFLVDAAHNVEVFGYGVGTGARDFNANQLIRQAFDQGKLREIYDDNGRMVENHGPAYTMAKVQANNKEEAARKAIELNDKANQDTYVERAAPVQSDYARLMLHHMHIDRDSQKVASLAKIDANVGDLFEVAKARADGGRSLAPEVREKYRDIAKAIPADTFSIDSVEQIRKIAYASSQARAGLVISGVSKKDGTNTSIEFDAPAAKSGPLVKNGSRDLDDGTKNVLMVGGSRKPTEAQVAAIDESVKSLAKNGFGVVTVFGNKANEAVIDAALRHDAKLTVITPRSRMVQDFSSEERAVLSRVLSHKDGVVIGKYEVDQGRQPAGQESEANRSKRLSRDDGRRERAAYQIGSDMSQAVILTKAKETERVVYEVAKMGQTKPVATLPAYEIADTGNRLLTVPFESARSTRVIGTTVSASFSSAMNTEADAERGALRDNASIWQSKRESDPLVNVHQKGEISVQWHDPAAHMKTRGTVEGFVNDWAEKVAKGEERGMVNPEIRNERDLARARNIDTEVKNYALEARTDGLVTDESDRDVQAVSDYREVEDRMIEALDNKRREIANQNIQPATKRVVGGREM